MSSGLGGFVVARISLRALTVISLSGVPMNPLCSQDSMVRSRRVRASGLMADGVVSPRAASWPEMSYWG